MKRKSAPVILVLLALLFLLFPQRAQPSVAPVNAGGPQGGASKALHGLCFSPYIELDPNMGATVTPERISSLMDIVAPYTGWVRTFGARSGLEHAPGIAKDTGLRVAAGCWLSADMAANALEIASLVQLAESGQVDIAVVGSEVLLRGDLTEGQLIGYIDQVKATGVPTTTCDTWDRLLSHPNVVAECDVVMANFYPYLEGVSIGNALHNLETNYGLLEQAAGGRKVMVGETGWPSAGNQVGAAVPSPENQVRYLRGFLDWAAAENVDYFLFEAFDEPWKAAYEGPQGAHWGLWDKDGRLKPGMEAVIPPLIPAIFSITPTSGPAGTALTVTGTNFGSARRGSYVVFGKEKAGSYSSWSDSRICCSVPEGVEGKNEVTVTTGAGTSNSKDFTVTQPAWYLAEGTKLMIAVVLVAVLALVLVVVVRRRPRPLKR